MRIVTVLPLPTYLGVYEFENPQLIESFHQNTFDIIGGIFREILPPLTECAIYFGCIHHHLDDDSIYQYADEIYRTTIIDKYRQYSQDLAYFVHDNHTDLVNMAVYLSIEIGRKVHSITPNQSLGVVINDIEFKHQHYHLSYTIGDNI